MILPFYYTYAMRLQQRRLRDDEGKEGRHSRACSLALSLSDPIGFVVSVSISATAAVTPIATVELIQSLPAQNEPAYLATVGFRETAGGLGESPVPLFCTHRQQAIFAQPPRPSFSLQILERGQSGPH